MSRLQALSLPAAGTVRSVRMPTPSRFVSLHLFAVAGDLVHTSGEGESCALVLGGTFDLRGGTTQWPNRGARASPFQGRPVAVFLPPATEFAASNGNGEILVVEAHKPKGRPIEGRAALGQSPLLPLAGSGKAFDPARGEWLPAESFPTAAESLPPRRIAQVPCGETRVERVFAADYKAEALCVDEAVIGAGRRLDLAHLPMPPGTDETILFVRCAAPARITAGTDTATVSGDAVLIAHGHPSSLAITAGASDCYVVLAAAPK